MRNFLPAFRLSTLFVLVATSTCFGQLFQNDKSNYTPPTPNAAALLEYASIPVNLHTGTAEISVPLYELRGRQASIPISVSYHASGIKVQDISGSVGLGWVLNAGGVVTRLIRGLPDDGPAGYFNLNFNTSFNDIYGMTEGDIDTEPDIFFFNFNGKTGRLVMDPNQNVIPLPETDLKIVKPVFSSADPTWEITDANGVRYVFGKTSNAREVSSVNIKTQYAPNKEYPEFTTPFSDKAYSAISTWYLSEIQYPFGEVVTFTYQQGNSIFFERYMQSVQSNIQDWHASCGSPWIEPNVLDHITKVTVAQPKYISSIQTSLGTASFSYSSGRQDITNAHRLTEVKVTNNESTEIKKYAFDNNSYFTSDGCASQDCKRLKLDRIRLTTNGTNVLFRSFNYYNVNLPSRKSVKFDHWGYYNNNPHSRAIPPSKVYPVWTAGNPPTVESYKSFSGADKTPDLSRTKANVLVQITNHAGAIQTLNYELNQYDDNGTIKDTGGLRISQIIEDDGSGVNATITKNYKYKRISDPAKSSGLIYRKYYYDYNFNNMGYCEDGWGFQQFGVSLAYRFSFSATDLYDIGGMQVGYSDVQIEYSNGAKEWLFYTNFLSRPDDEPVYIAPSGYTGPNFQDFTDPDGPPFIPKGDRSFERGLLTKHIYFNHLGKKLKSISNEYDFYLVTSREAPGGKAMFLALNHPAEWVRKGKYLYTHRGLRLLDTTEKIYDQTDENFVITNKTTFTYSPTYTSQVKTIINHLNDGSQLKKEFKYPFEYNTVTFGDGPSAGIHRVKSKYMIGIPLETVVWFKKPGGTFRVIEGSLQTFQWDIFSNTTTPYQLLKLRVGAPLTDFNFSSVSVVNSRGDFSKDSRYYVVLSNTLYDSDGNLLQQSSLDGTIRKYDWGYNNSLVTKITTNPSTDPTRPPQVQSFEHAPLIGVTKITDPALRNTFFSYDILNRLKLVKDNEQNILTRYRYHFKNSDELNSNFSVSGSRIKGQQMYYSATVSGETVGQTTYTWDFGDGNVLENAGPTITHTYNTSGGYIVKLLKSNPEYPPEMTSQFITIYPQFSGSISSSESHIDFCSPVTTITLSAWVTGGCAGLTYEWYSSSSPTTGFSSISGAEGATIEYSHCSTGTMYFKCTISDDCGNVVTPEPIAVTYQVSSPHCPTCPQN